MNRQQILERERAQANYAGVAALLVALAFIGSIIAVSSVTLPKGLPTDLYRDFDSH